jgi:hypothetical protein
VNDTRTTNNLVNQLRNISKVIEHDGITVRFPAPDGEFADECPFVDKACEAIEHGGELDATSLASLVYYIADMMEV